MLSIETRFFLGSLYAQNKMVNYPPYVDSYGQIKTLFEKIREASVPPKFTNDFIYSMLGLKSTSYRAMIPLLKKLGFINDAQAPTSAYKEYRDPDKSKFIMAERVKDTYKELYSSSEYAHKLKKEEVVSKLVSVLGVSKDDKTIPKVALTFLELVRLSDFSVREDHPVHSVEENITEPVTEKTKPSLTKLGISYTINLNLPLQMMSKFLMLYSKH